MIVSVNFNLLSLFSLFRSKGQEPLAQASSHLSDCFYRPGARHHGFHFCCPEQAFSQEVQGMTDTISERLTVC